MKVHGFRQILFMAAVCTQTLACTTAMDSGPGPLEGETIQHLSWEGYVNETADGLSVDKPYRDFGTADLAADGRRYALLHTAEAF